MRKLIIAGSAMVMAAAMGMTSFGAGTVSSPSAGPGSFAYCRFVDENRDGVCDTCDNSRAHCGHSGHTGACSYGSGCENPDRAGCGDRAGVCQDGHGCRQEGHWREGSRQEGRRGHHGCC